MTTEPRPFVHRRHIGTDDLGAIEAKWLQLCAACDAGLSMSCTCPDGDPRNVISNLVDEVRSLRAQLTFADQIHPARAGTGSPTPADDPRTCDCEECAAAFVRLTAEREDARRECNEHKARANEAARLSSDALQVTVEQRKVIADLRDRLGIVEGDRLDLQVERDRLVSERDDARFIAKQYHDQAEHLDAALGALRLEVGAAGDSPTPGVYDHYRLPRWLGGHLVEVISQDPGNAHNHVVRILGGDNPGETLSVRSTALVAGEEPVAVPQLADAYAVNALSDLRVALAGRDIQPPHWREAVPAALSEIDRLRAELSQVQKERDALRSGLIERGVVPEVITSLTTADVLREVDAMLEHRRRARAERDEAHRDLAAARDRLDANGVIPDRYDAAVSKRDEARAVLAALRTEVGKIAKDWMARANDFRMSLRGSSAEDAMDVAAATYDACAVELRALVTDQSPAAPAVCRCPTNEVGDIRCHNCGERVNKRCWKCDTPRGDGPCPTAGLSPTSDTQTSDGSES